MEAEQQRRASKRKKDESEDDDDDYSDDDEQVEVPVPRKHQRGGLPKNDRYYDQEEDGLVADLENQPPFLGPVVTHNEWEQLKMENERLKKRNKMIQNGKGYNKKNKKENGQRRKKSAKETEIENIVKVELWQQTKNITTSKKLVIATNIVLKECDTTEFDGLTGQALKDAKEDWVRDHQEIVLSALNSHRNYCVGELRGEMMTAFRNDKQGEYPNKDQMINCILRDKESFSKAGDKKENGEMCEKLLACVHDKLISKVAGKDRWCPTKRHYGTLSGARPKRK